MATSTVVQEFPRFLDGHLSDSQVMRILETRQAGAAENSPEQRDAAQVELLRPDDTGTRRILKEAVAHGVPVPFAVQLEWSVHPIDAARVPLLDIFKGHTLYRTEKRRDGRSCYFLRLGFFTDALAAKEFASRVRSTFASAAVVPVTEQEFLHADEARIDTGAPAGPYHEGGEAEAPASARFTAPGAQNFFFTLEPESPGNSKKPSRPETLEDKLKTLAQREMWRQADPVNDSGVRHMRVMLEEQPTKSAQKAKSTQKQKPPIRLA